MSEKKQKRYSVSETDVYIYELNPARVQDDAIQITEEEVKDFDEVSTRWGAWQTKLERLRKEAAAKNERHPKA